MTTTSYKIASDLFLVRAPTPTAAQTRVVKPKPTNHVVVVDVSGSMSSELPKLRSQPSRRCSSTPSASRRPSRSTSARSRRW